MSFRGYKDSGNRKAQASNAADEDGFVDRNAELDRKRQALMDDFKTNSFRQPDSEQQRFEEMQ